jgi:hypothetical protein
MSDIIARALANSAKARIVNVQDYGAKGDGVTDDGPAIRAAVNYALQNDLTVYFPTATYVINSVQTTTVSGFQVSAGIVHDVVQSGGNGHLHLLFAKGAILKFTAANTSYPTYAIYVNEKNPGWVSTPDTFTLENARIQVTNVNCGGILIRDTAAPILRDVLVEGPSSQTLGLGLSSTADGIRFENTNESGQQYFCEGIRCRNVMTRGFQTQYHFTINGGTNSFMESSFIDVEAHLDQNNATGFLFENCQHTRSTFINCGGWQGAASGGVMFSFNNTLDPVPLFISAWCENTGSGTLPLFHCVAGYSHIISISESLAGNSTLTDTYWGLQLTSYGSYITRTTTNMNTANWLSNPSGQRGLAGWTPSTSGWSTDIQDGWPGWAFVYTGNQASTLTSYYIPNRPSGQQNWSVSCEYLNSNSGSNTIQLIAYDSNFNNLGVFASANLHAYVSWNQLAWVKGQTPANTAYIAVQINVTSYGGTLNVSRIKLCPTVFFPFYSDEASTNPVWLGQVSQTINSGTVYQNTYGVPITIYLPAYATTPGTAGTVTAAFGSTNTPSTLYTQQIAGSTTSSQPGMCVLRVPPNWYYKFTASGVTFGTPSIVGE